MKAIQTSLGKVDIQDFLNSISKLKLPDLESFSKEVLKILEKKKTADFIKKEQELMDKIKNGGPPKKFQQRQKELLLKPVQGVINDKEHQEALKMIPVAEQWAVERTKLMLELAELWETSLEEVLKRLDITTPNPVYVQ